MQQAALPVDLLRYQPVGENVFHASKKYLFCDFSHGRLHYNRKRDSSQTQQKVTRPITMVADE